MHTIYITTDVAAKANFEHLIPSLPPEDSAELFLLQDQLNIGSLQEEGLSFSLARTGFRNLLLAQSLSLPVDDLERLMDISTRLSNGENAELCFWMGANAADVCAYYWLLHYLKKHQGKLSVINLAGLPFLNEENHLFYPISVSQLSAKELKKSLKLKRQISASEWETDREEWKKLREENAEIRLLTEGKQLKRAAIDYFDKSLITLHEGGTAKRRSTLLQLARTQNKFQVSEAFLQYRMRILEENGSISSHQNKNSEAETTT